MSPEIEKMDVYTREQRVLVTGGASGIQRGIAEAFGRSGARVAHLFLQRGERR